MAKEKKQVREITSMSEDFAQWYTDVVVKAGLIGYTSVKGCMAWTNVSRKQVLRMSTCRCLSLKVCSRKRKIM